MDRLKDILLKLNKYIFEQTDSYPYSINILMIEKEKLIEKEKIIEKEKFLSQKQADEIRDKILEIDSSIQKLRGERELF